MRSFPTGYRRVLAKKKTHIINLYLLWLRLLSGGVVVSERAVRCFWRAGVCALFFCALWLFNIPALFGVFGQVLAFTGFLGGVGYFLWRDGRGFRLPSRGDIDRRIERDSAVRNRPLSEQDDRLANPQKLETRGLWSMARSRLRVALPLLRPAKIKAFMAANDPYALRFCVLMAFCLGLVTAGAEWKPRLINGLSPFSLTGSAAAEADAYTIWITPPDYTQLPQVVLNEKTIQGETLKIPQGSVLKVIVNERRWGNWGKPSLYLGEQEFEFDIGGQDSYGLEIALPDSNAEMVLKRGYFGRASWPIEIVADSAPRITLGEEPYDVLDNGEIRFDVSVFDDYGVEYLSIDMRLDAMVEDAPLGEAVHEQRSVISPPAQDFGISPVYDLTAHSWAGLPVSFTFSVTDKAGHATKSGRIAMVLPERVFKHPVAKTLVALRKKLAWQPDAQSTYAATEHDLRTLLTTPEFFQNDILVYMAIRSAAARLDYNAPSIRIAREVMGLLWDSALRIEDGDLSLSARKLRDAQLALEDALKNPDLSNEEIAQLVDDLRAAMAEYFQELGRELQKRANQQMEDMAQIPPELLAQSLTPDALGEFLDKLQSDLSEGKTESAQELLSQLQRLLDTLNPSMQTELPQDMQTMQEGVNELQELIERQEALLEQTEQQVKILESLLGLGFEYRQNDNQPAKPFINTKKNKAEQDALRYILGQLMLDVNEVLDNIPESMGLAEREMRGSSEALGLSAPDDSAPHQERAIEYLKDAREDLSKQFQTRMQQLTGFSLSFGGQQRLDPLGRPIDPNGGPNGKNHDSRVKFPDEAERRRVQEILQKLRRRAGQPNRPREEIEYYRRLLKRF